VVQKRYGDQWQGVAFCRQREPLIREVKKLLGLVPEVLLSLPKHHDPDEDPKAQTAVEAPLLSVVAPEVPRAVFNPHGATLGALQGDDYQLEYYEDGYPKLPACLDRARKPDDSELAA
jgi:hypothetical protein